MPKKGVVGENSERGESKIETRIESFEVQREGGNTNRADHVTISHERKTEGPII